MNRTCRVMICDDHEHARKAMRMILSRDPFFEVVAEARSGKRLLETVAEVHPDLVLMDIHMPDMDGLETTRRLKEMMPSVKIVMVTVSDDVADLFEAVKRGAQGYLVKNLNPSVWLEYLRSVAKDEMPMSGEIARRILREFTASPSPPKGNPVLTPREQEILGLVSRGMSNRQIAESLCISEHTVKNHLKNIMQKLHLKNRVELTRYAFEQGLTGEK
ncbi:response regulator [Staphylospora marina]|uniref:response regulator n=1 Tax=Staphylospora marina TaxID=2490858 RepID=UPI000F5B9B8A|nr:response regulator transcription factor [Staphylospora marina]